MTSIVTSAKEIPDAPCYVLATDKFMSGWGHAEGRDNVVCCPCKDYHQARTVEANLARRPEMKRVRVVGNKPRLRPEWVVSVLTEDEAPLWYKW